MKDNARTRGFSGLYAGVRPTQKHLQSRLPIEVPIEERCIEIEARVVVMNSGQNGGRKRSE
jgi:hypothetical protein